MGERMNYQTKENMNDLFGTEPHKLHRVNSPRTSRNAAHAVDTTKLEKLVFDAIKSEELGCISDDLLSYFPDYPYSSITARYAALQRKQLITCGPDTRTGDSGRQQRVMRAVG